MNQVMEIRIATHIITSSDPHGENVYSPIQKLNASIGNIVKIPCNFKVLLSSSYYGFPIQGDQQKSIIDPEYYGKVERLLYSGNRGEYI